MPSESSGFNFIYEVLRGSCAGAVTGAVVTPGLNWTNAKYSNVAFDWNLFTKSVAGGGSYRFNTKGPFSSMGNYSIAVGRNIGAVVVLRQAVIYASGRQESELSNTESLVVSSVTGAAAGMATSTTREAIGQTVEALKQTENCLTTNGVRSAIIANRGRSGLWQGNLALGGRETAFILACFWANPLIKSFLHSKIESPIVRDSASAVTIGLVTGPLTHVLHNLRHGKQANLLTTPQSPSYAEIMRTRFFYRKNESFSQYKNRVSRGCGARTATLSAAVFCIGQVTDAVDKIVGGFAKR